MKQIPLTQGQVALVDDEDYEIVMQYKWNAVRFKHSYYAVRGAWIEKKVKRIHLHRFLMNPADGMVVDHIDGDGLNNTRANLRVCTNFQNIQNQRRRTTNKSGYKGVWWNPDLKKWRVRIRVNGKSLSVGHYDSAIDAANAYDETVRKHFGEFARTNF